MFCSCTPLQLSQGLLKRNLSLLRVTINFHAEVDRPEVELCIHSPDTNGNIFPRLPWIQTTQLWKDQCMCLLWPVNCKLCFAAGPKKNTAAFLKSKSFLHESDKDKKSWQRRLAIKIHLCPIRARAPITKIVMTCAGNKTPDTVDFWAGHCLRQKLKLILTEMIYSLNGNPVPGICPKGLKPTLPRQTDCLATRWSMLVWWAHLMKGLICIQV